jgi:hypothetical protein
VGFHSLTTTTHPPNANIPSSGQQVTARLSTRKVSVAVGNRAQDPMIRDTTSSVEFHLLNCVWMNYLLVYVNTLTERDDSYIANRILIMNWRKESNLWICYASYWTTLYLQLILQKISYRKFLKILTRYKERNIETCSPKLLPHKWN